MVLFNYLIRLITESYLVMLIACAINLVMGYTDSDAFQVQYYLSLVIAVSYSSPDSSR